MDIPQPLDRLIDHPLISTVSDDSRIVQEGDSAVIRDPSREVFGLGC